MTRASQDGFTLLELLVSMTLLGLVFVILFGGLRFGTRAWERGSIETDATDEIRLVQALIAGELERACPRRIYPAVQSPAVPRVEFFGGARHLDFLAPPPASSGATGCARIALAVEPDGNLQRLVFAVQTLDRSDGDQGDVKRTDLLRRARTIEISYLGRTGTGWRPTWTGATDLPSLIRVRVTFPDGDARVWPELYAMPHISAEADCTYDPITKSCQSR